MSKEDRVVNAFQNYNNKMESLENDTVLSRWGMYTQDERYKDDTAKIVNMIKEDMQVNTDQAYYLLYFMVSNNEDYLSAKEQMEVDELFEIYSKK